MKYKVVANSKYHYEIEPENAGFVINGNNEDLDIRPIGQRGFHVLHRNQSFLADVVEVNRAEKFCLIKVNGNAYRLELQDQYDTLLHKLGLDSMQKHKVDVVKAPMPGLVLDVLVEEGAVVKKGDNLFILEAMKMENIIKAPGDGTVKSVKASAGNKVEKGQAIIVFG